MPFWSYSADQLAHYADYPQEEESGMPWGRIRLVEHNGREGYHWEQCSECSDYFQAWDPRVRICRSCYEEIHGPESWVEDDYTAERRLDVIGRRPSRLTSIRDIVSRLEPPRLPATRQVRDFAETRQD